MLQDLLAAANQYALDWLKLMCTRKLWDNVSVDTVVIILVCAETYGCQELKKKCLDFCVVEKIFKEVASTNGYVLLMLKFALLLLRRKGRDIRRQVIWADQQIYQSVPPCLSPSKCDFLRTYWRYVATIIGMLQVGCSLVANVVLRYCLNMYNRRLLTDI